MQDQVSKSEFKARALELFRQIESSGEAVIITDHGKPTIEVRRFHHTTRNPLDILRDSVTKYENPTGPVGDDDWKALGGCRT